MWIPRTHEHKSLMLLWRSFSSWGREGIAICCAKKGCQKLPRDWLLPIADVSSQDKWPKFIDAPLTVILPLLYPQYAIIWFGTCHLSHCLAAFPVFSFTFFLITTLFFSNTWICIMSVSKISCLSVNAHHQLPDRSNRCSCLQNACEVHYHTTESVLTFISHHIWIKIGIVLGILIMIDISHKAKSYLRIRISAQQIDDVIRLHSGNVTGWRWWRAWHWWRQLWTLLCASGGWR